MRTCGKGPGPASPCLVATCEVHAFCTVPALPPPPPQGPGLTGFFRAALSAVAPALWAAVLGGPSHGKVTTVGGTPMLWAGLSEMVALQPFAPILSWRCLQVEGVPCVTAASPCDFCLCPTLLSLGSEEMRSGVSLGPPWSRGLGVYGVPSSAGEPYPCSVPPPGRGGSEKEGVRDPAFWARKVAKAEVRGVARLSGHRRGPHHHADPSRLPQG